ncbi:MAG: hypothetical protein US57_C0004G0005 [Candidatus Moranbacteria bacterium GW2011_GWC2_37_73]|nr:MAG: hypothetical protein UR95_C0002G0094 [Parcubacteria group bacterium GW2011_GWC1_36_108]KKQ01063.1 MAG: hypothetical protein US09_C0003G0063 [Candidatus Moranbacteria bacterium GW2011_GWD1_36_198]KKQ02465.1 MAG: hypothetical protein US10_C0001G0063 [Candidatus Moranbacteria bacterium GW2011_GWD2_36_198]KKQ40122.1 MAG: hypothetical protein US57_C0004G0005 [Candidatus Moranbacteria bacterium GW2011_GWC2_37_73]HAS00257.1 hypothetical protein [Candidatus Moranbacteria bacterium]
MKKFIKQKKTSRKLFLFLSGIIFLLVHVLVFNVFLGKPFTFANALETVSLNQKIKPLDPIEDTSPLEKENKKIKELSSSEFRLITPLIDSDRNGDEDKNNDEDDNNTDIDTDVISEEKNVEVAVGRIKIAPVTTFSGTSLYPNSEVFLDVHSDRFFSSTLSDNEGRWTWTNIGNPLEEGEHSMEAYSIAPTELSNKRDVLAQKYFFTVVKNGIDRFNIVSLGDSQYAEKGGNDDLGDRIKNNTLSSTYVFSAAFPSKKEYSFGDDMKIELLFKPLVKNTKNEAEVEYVIFREDSDYENSKEPSSVFSDRISLDDGGYFLKNIKLKENIIPGGYVMKIVAKIGNDKYYQSLKFNVTSKALMTIGSNVVTVEKFGQVLVFNVIFIMVVLIILVSLVISELRRYMIYRPVSENTLKRRGYFTK